MRQDEHFPIVASKNTRATCNYCVNPIDLIIVIGISEHTSTKPNRPHSLRSVSDRKSVYSWDATTICNCRSRKVDCVSVSRQARYGVTCTFLAILIRHRDCNSDSTRPFACGAITRARPLFLAATLGKPLAHSNTPEPTTLM